MNSLLPRLRRRARLFAFGACALLLANPAFAGTPLICHPYEIGSARSLPAGDDMKGTSARYDTRNLIPDTLALLSPDMPVIVRMETLRRAAIYATGLLNLTRKDTTAKERAPMEALLAALKERTEKAAGRDRALALFDLGFFSETLRHANVDTSLNGYELLVQALQLRGADPEMEFALALANSWPNERQKERTAHLAKARAAATGGSLLARNLASHFGGS